MSRMRTDQLHSNCDAVSKATCTIMKPVKSPGTHRDRHAHACATLPFPGDLRHNEQYIYRYGIEQQDYDTGHVAALPTTKYSIQRHKTGHCVMVRAVACWDARHNDTGS